MGCGSSVSVCSRKPNTSREGKDGRPLTKSKKVNRKTLDDELLRGKINIECSVKANVVRIFLSSTFTDTTVERNALMEKVYPNLRSFCQEHGYSFQVVDMRWGIRHDSTNDHMTTELCMKELKECQKLSTGPNFVTLLSHKYGYRPLPRVIEATEFETLLSSVAEEQAKGLLQKWFTKDNNIVPPAYILLPISTHLPDYVSKSSEGFNDAKKTWNKEHDKMRRALCDSALKQKDFFETEEDRLKYSRSVTENEITEGVLNASSGGKHCLWFERIIPNIQEQKDSTFLSRYMECEEPDKTEARQMLDNLRSKLKATIPGKGLIIEHEVGWKERGIDPQTPDHAKYIMDLCKDFEKHLKEQIKEGIEVTSRKEPLYEELQHHVSFCQEKCRTFQGQEKALNEIKQYIDSESRLPLVVHGESGCGKTSVLAQAAKMFWEWKAGESESVVVLRFIGTTPESSNIRLLLSSVISQIKKAFGNRKPPPADIKGLMEELKRTLALAKPEKQLLILLDALDQFDTEGGARQLGWIPKPLPPNVKLVVSTLPDKEYDCFQRLQEQKSQFLEIVPDTDSRSILREWLKLKNRTLTEAQENIVVNAFEECRLPLYLKLCFDEACKWSSFSPQEKTRLKKTVKDVIETLFSNVEKSHGEMLTPHALAYITLSRNGLAEAELEDILSCDEEVLDDVYEYWPPPIRRLPPLLIVRIRADLRQYLVDRGADGVKVIYWYHRQFIEAAKTRYCSGAVVRRERHCAIAEYFMGKWEGKVKPYFNRKIEKQSATDRLVAAQPLEFGKRHNLRKLMELPLHLIEAELLTELKDEVLLNLEWLLAKLQATSFRDVIDDFNMARTAFPSDSEIKTASQLLQLSREAVTGDHRQLPGQLLGRMNSSLELGSLRNDCLKTQTPSLIPDKPFLMPPGKELRFMFKAHDVVVTGLGMTADGKYAITVGLDDELRAWDVQNGNMVNGIVEDLGDATQAVLCCGDKYIAISSPQEITLRKFPSGEASHKIDTKSVRIPEGGTITGVAVCGENDSQIAVLVEKWLVLVDVKSGEQLWHVEAEDQSPPVTPLLAGHTNHVVIAQGNTLRLVNLERREFGCNPINLGIFDIFVNRPTFTKDGSKIIVSSLFKDAPLVFNVETGALVEKYIEGCFGGEYRLTADGRYLYEASGEQVHLWDLQQQKEFYLLNQYSMIEDVVTQDAKTFVTVGGGCMLHIWDTTEGEGNETSPELSNPPSTTDSKQSDEELDFKAASDFRMMVNPFCSVHALVRLEYEEELSDKLIVYDFAQEKCVRSALIQKNTLNEPRLCDWEFVNRTSVLCSDNRRLKLLDLSDMKFMCTFPGKLHKFRGTFAISANSTVAIALTRDGKGIKIMDIKKCEKTGSMTPEAGNLLGGYMSVNESGSMAVVSERGGVLLVADLQARQFLRSMQLPDNTGSTHYKELHLENTIFTPGGKTLIRNLTMEVEGREITLPSISDPGSGKVIKEMMSPKPQTGKKRDIRSERLLMLDESTLAAGCSDGVIRLWNINTGELTKELKDRTRQLCDISLPDNRDLSKQHSDANYMLSITKGTESYISLWNIKTRKRQASFRLDYDWHCAFSLGDGSVIKLFDDNSKELVTLKLRGAIDCPQFNKEIDFPKAELKGIKRNIVIECPSPDDDEDDLSGPDEEEDEHGDDDQDDPSSSDEDEAESDNHEVENLIGGGGGGGDDGSLEDRMITFEDEDYESSIGSLLDDESDEYVTDEPLEDSTEEKTDQNTSDDAGNLGDAFDLLFFYLAGLVEPDDDNSSGSSDLDHEDKLDDFGENTNDEVDHPFDIDNEDGAGDHCEVLQENEVQGSDDSQRY